MLSAIICYAGAVIFVLLSIGCLIFQVNISMDAREQVRFQFSSILFFLILTAALFMIAKLAARVAEISSGRLFLLFSVLYIIAGIYLIAGVDASPRGDPAMVLKYAFAFNEGDYSGLTTGKYLNFFPYQLGYLTYERLLIRICSSTRFLFSVNLGLVILINYANYRITDLLTEGNKAVDNFSIILSFLFLPQFFYILWLYGQIPGLCFTELSVLFLFREIKGKGRWNWIFTGIFLALACLVKPNYVIAAIAMSIVCLLEAVLHHKWKLLLLIGFIIAAVYCSDQMLDSYYRSVSKVDFGEGSPMSLNITMGMQDTGNGRLGGWYNGYVFDTYENNHYDSEKSAQTGRQDLAKRLNYMEQHPLYTLGFFTKKVLSTWCEPTFQSIWSGPMEDCGQYTHTFILQSIYTAGVAAELLKLFMHAETWIIYILLPLFMLLRRKNAKQPLTPMELYPVIYFVGGFMYHLISETKSQYVYMYVYSLIPLAATAIPMINSRMPRIRMKMRKKLRICRNSQ